MEHSEVRIPEHESSEVAERESEDAITVLDRLLTAEHDRSYQSLEQARAAARTIDTGVNRIASAYERTLARILERYGSTAEVEKIGTNLFRLRTDKTLDLPTLPHGYGYAGGAARALLLRTLNVDPEARPRDLDPVRLTDDAAPGVDEAVSAEISPDDLAHGHGVQVMRSDYFQTRDFTVNEVIAYRGWLYVTKQCLLDSVRRIIRFSRPPNTESETTLEHDKLLAKAVRFAAIELARGERMALADNESYKLVNISPFHLALHLDRAYQQDAATAEAYVRELVARGQLPPTVESAEQAMAYLDDCLDSPFVYQHAPDRVVATDEAMANDAKRLQEPFSLEHSSVEPATVTEQYEDDFREIIERFDRAQPPRGKK